MTAPASPRAGGARVTVENARGKGADPAATLMEMDMEMEDDSLNDGTMFCPRCRSALYPTADSKKPFLMSCRVCKYEHQLDYEISFEKHKVNKNVNTSKTVRKQGDKENMCAKVEGA